jgi:glycosyltransferase involved in cell wall biosynthesis
VSAPVDLDIVVIARDEEANLPVLFDSLGGLRGHPSVRIVVVDTGSIDATRDVAAAAGAEVHRFAWRDDFSAARNHALSLCRARFILWLDADDVLPPETSARLLGTLGRWHPGAAYAFRIVSPGPDGSRTEFSQIRLIPGGRGLRFRNPVHESLGESVAEAGLAVADGGLAILHTGYREARLVDRKHRRNLALLERAIAADSPAPSLLLVHARMCLAMNRPHFAERSLTRMLPRVDPDSDLAMAARIHLGQSLLLQDRNRDALEILEDARARHGGNAQYLLEYGKALWMNGLVPEAREAWRACLAAGGAPAFSSIPTDWEAVLAGARKLLAEAA